MARLGAPHGVRGAIRLTAFTDDPGRLLDYRTFVTAAGRPLTLSSLAPAARGLVATFEEIGDRDAAAGLTHRLLLLARARLPALEDPDEFYEADLVGLSAVDGAGAALGPVIAVHDFGAGPLLEIAPAGRASILVPFTRAAVPVVDAAAGRVVIEPPAGLVEEDGRTADEAAPEAPDDP